MSEILSGETPKEWGGEKKFPEATPADKVETFCYIMHHPDAPASFKRSFDERIKSFLY